MAQWCPNCRAEYVEGWETCSTCGVRLVDRLPPEHAVREELRSPAPHPPDPDRFDDPFVAVWEGPTPEAQRLLRLIEAAYIPVDLGDATLVGHARVEVPRSYERDARDVIERDDGSEPPPLDTEPVVPDTPTRFDWTPVVRIALAAVVVGLIALLFLTGVAAP